MPNMQPTHYDRMVDLKQGTISREIFSSKEIFEEELEKIFTRAWLFVGHESQIPNPGDFYTSRMGAESVILTRDKKGKVHVFLNSCRHRGMKVCQYDHGNTQLFTCPYHSWSYTTEGKLFGVPQYKAIYDGNLCKEDWSLIEVPKLETYKGTVWASWDKDAPDFLTYLGDARTHLDLALDHRDGREGGSEVLVGVHKWIIPCNWKFAAENFLGDTYHNVSHRSVDLIGIGPSAEVGVKGRRDNELEYARHLWVNFPAGHGVHSAIVPENAPFVDTFQNNPIIAEYFRHCHEERKRRLGEERSRLVPFVGTIYPNVSFHGKQPRNLCIWHPHGPEATEAWRFFLVDADAPQEVKDFLRTYYMRYSGPAGMTEQDDMENWNYATAGSRGVIAKRYPYNYQQSLGAVTNEGPVPGNVSLQVSEENPRQYYRRWRDYMNGADWDTLLGRNDNGPASFAQ
ncbi:aromatic ring-hydroxylating dioxygenase subunit alpha [Bordetella bronchiseptica]|uniref:Aromatic ring-hydroxylating dioxygenase subunit alpha n=2 Tax=Alcaligenaceae TaxID=506 RepID=A0ABX4F6P1_9BORD|nr:Rieske 2Fe-2S domain-containing protein [Bordetella bronchiseptica]AWP73591.1 aromatic ring-hydroxylating dioxygenase subunit alpha [Bordetella bronchiseptica]MCE7074882.1 aromatic ring-hydroxylating dioxygenase subunit alpha [Bordetella bronchiseptica]OZI69939.1 aromatic ring-hydroxylating dioxygenase subunit alpha [Bordetella genomosp. 6]RFT75840.1 aromatic ring-hydroxylating dioxygenase subunit alpha [Bordetella bronchiseptica]